MQAALVVAGALVTALVLVLIVSFNLSKATADRARDKVDPALQLQDGGLAFPRLPSTDSYYLGWGFLYGPSHQERTLTFAAYGGLRGQLLFTESPVSA